MFADDLWSYVGERRRPPHKWFLVGPERSGSKVHIDPLATSAWNTVIVGKKRWVIFPPETAKSTCEAAGLFEEGEDDEAGNYFMKVLERLKASNPDLVCYEFTQNPGETLLVPSGWWHAVLNLEDTVAITQNFCSPWNFDRVWRSARDGRPKTSQVRSARRKPSGARAMPSAARGRKARPSAAPRDLGVSLLTEALFCCARFARRSPLAEVARGAR
jgi:histone arginine demethylase JMJD6